MSGGPSVTGGGPGRDGHAAGPRRPAGAGALTAVIFDMDGVLADSEPLCVEAMRQALSPWGVAYSDRDNDEFVGRVTLEHCAVLRERHALPVSAGTLARRYLDALLGLLRAGAPPMPGVPHVLLGLRQAGYRLALASSAEPQVIAATTGALGIAALFEALVSGTEVPRGKPAPDVFLEAARRLGVAPGACLVVEDSRNGLLAALAAGMTCAVIPCAATRGQDFTGAHHRLEGLPDLLSLLA